MESPCFVAVSSTADTLAAAITANLEATGVRACRVEPAALGDLSVSLSGDTFTVDGKPVAGILFRSFPDTSFSNGFMADDQSFCDAEIGATWLAALQLESVFAVNRYTADIWFEACRWPCWRRLLVEAGIVVSEFAFGDVETEDTHSWYPYASTTAETAPDRAARRVLGSAVTTAARKQTSVMVCGEVIAGDVQPAILDTTRLLDQVGIKLAEIETDFDGRILRVNAHPVITNAELLARASKLLITDYHAHLRNW